MFSNLENEVEQSQQDSQGESSGTIHLLVSNQVAEPEGERNHGLVHLAHLLS